MGRIPDGVIDLTRPDVVAALQAMVALGSVDNFRSMVSLLSAASTDELIEIRQALNAGACRRPEDQVVRDVEQAAPRLAGVAGLIRNRDNRLELTAWLTLLATIIGIMIAVKVSHPEVTPSRQEQIIQCVVPTQQGISTSQGRAGHRQPGRNERCPCGSGMKFKRCHGSPMAPALGHGRGDRLTF